MRVARYGGIVFSRCLMPSQPATSSGSASAYFFRPRSAAQSRAQVSNVDQTSGAAFSRSARHSRRIGPAADHFRNPARAVPTRANRCHLDLSTSSI